MNIRLNKTRFKSFIFIFLLLIGCTKEPDGDGASFGNSSVKLTINSDLKFGAVGTSSVLYPEESYIRNITLVIFNIDASGNYIFEKNEFFGYPSNTTSSKIITLDVQKYNKKKIFAIVNSHNESTKEIRSIKALNDYQLAATDYFVAGSEFVHHGAVNDVFNMLPMSGESSEFDATLNSTTELTIVAVRRYSRIDVSLKIDASSCTFTEAETISDTQYTTTVNKKGNFFGNLLVPTVSDDLLSLDITHGTTPKKSISETSFTPIFSVYTPSYKYGSADTKMQIDVKNLSIVGSGKFDLEPIVLDKTTNEGTGGVVIDELKPNHVYDINATIRNKGEITFTTEVVNWTEELLDVEIPTISIFAASTVIMDYNKNTATYETSIPFVASDVVTVHLEDGTLINDGETIPTGLDWLKSLGVVFTDTKSGKIDLVSDNKAIEHLSDSLIVYLKCRKLTKKMVIKPAKTADDVVGLEITTEVVDWDDEMIDVVIPSISILAPSTVIMDYNKNTAVYETSIPFIASDIVSIHVNGNKVNDGETILTTSLDWLTSLGVIYTSDESGKIDLVSNNKATDNLSESLEVYFKCGKLTKKMVIKPEKTADDVVGLSVTTEVVDWNDELIDVDINKTSITSPSEVVMFGPDMPLTYATTVYFSATDNVKLYVNGTEVTQSSNLTSSLAWLTKSQVTYSDKGGSISLISNNSATVSAGSKVLEVKLKCGKLTKTMIINSGR